MLNDKYGLIKEEHISIFERFVRRNGNGVVLDLGCASRNPSDGISDLVKNYIGVDKSRLTREFFSAEVLPENSKFVCADVTNLPFADGSIDLVLMLGVYGALSMSSKDYGAFMEIDGQNSVSWTQFCFRNRKNLVSESSRVIKGTGRMIVSNSFGNSVDVGKAISEIGGYFVMDEFYGGEERYLMMLRPRKGLRKL